MNSCEAVLLLEEVDVGLVRFGELEVNVVANRVG